MSEGNTTEIQRSEAGMSIRQEFGATEVTQHAETAMAAMAAQHRAMVEARFIVAMRQGRNWLQIRSEINDLCADPEFAAEALYVKPLSKTPNDWNAIDKRERLRRRLDGEVGDWPIGFSARFIEAALFCCGHFRTEAIILWEDDEKRITQCEVIDLCKNSSRGRTIVTTKNIERRYAQKDAEPIATRYNTNGQLVYIYPANPDQVIQMEASAVSKSNRTLGEALLPPHFKREWRARIEKTILDQAAKDPKAEMKKLLDAFADKGIKPEQIEVYLDHSPESLQPAELVALRKIYVAIANGDCTWKEVFEAKFGTETGEESPAAKKIKDLLAKKQAEKKPATAPRMPQEVLPAVPEVSELPDLAQAKDGQQVRFKGALYTFVEESSAWRPDSLLPREETPAPSPGPQAIPPKRTKHEPSGFEL